MLWQNAARMDDSNNIILLWLQPEQWRGNNEWDFTAILGPKIFCPGLDEYR
ncbi:hypothetical protein SMGES_36890 [Serratia marcescens]|nr:hypothetical protein SMGES_36890 [Serratia marcescens]